MGGIFISHTQSDRTIAEALSGLVRELFGGKVGINYSSSRELRGGIAPGADWFNWIVVQVRESDLAFILLTPSSIQKPWVVWEAGAVAGAAYATSTDGADARRICPITFGLASDEVPSPFARTQLVRGTDAAEIRKLTQDLYQRFARLLSDDEKSAFGEKRGESETRYLTTLGSLLRTLPHTVTEAAVQEWLHRLEQLETEGRFSEVAVLDEWLDLAFGRDQADSVRPIDVRIHRRLGELYARAGMAAGAARQFELARQLAPRDVFLLRRQGKAYLDVGDREKCREVLEAINRLDPRAFERNIESAALKARWCEGGGDFLGAREVLTKAYHEIPSSYYLGDRLGQLLLAQAAIGEAQEVYRQVLNTVEQLVERNVWTEATGLTAAVVLGDEGRANARLAELKRLKPSREQRDTITRGLQKVVKAVSGEDAVPAMVLGFLAGWPND